MYPERYQLPAVTRHVLGLLERRRPALTRWDEYTEAQLHKVAEEALDEVGRQFEEVADDRAYWDRIRTSIREVVLPRYLRMAREFHQLEQSGYGAWRGGDALARLIYAAIAGGVFFLVLRLPVPRGILGPLLLAALALAPFIPDVQAWSARRHHRAELSALVSDMANEQKQLEAYRPLSQDKES